MPCAKFKGCCFMTLLITSTLRCQICSLSWESLGGIWSWSALDWCGRWQDKRGPVGELALKGGFMLVVSCPSLSSNTYAIPHSNRVLGCGMMGLVGMTGESCSALTLMYLALSCTLILRTLWDFGVEVGETLLSTSSGVSYTPAKPKY
ncbi:hypothetical protein XENORESO_002841 [Xenotaenia resolanae]|uniref:Uncharacterized protein n=1 Tax=Xenotaenia resolanae TaxID=208358 RepID=A0ABV0VLA2_9TELE